MKRTDITDIFPEATKDQIDRIMNLNGSDINGAKGETESLKTQLATALGEIETLKGGAGGHAEELKAVKDALAAAQAELGTMKRTEELRLMREKVANDKSVPTALLTGETEDDCIAQADAILAFAKTTGKYPVVHDGGEVTPSSTPATRDKFAEWAKDNL